MSKLTRKELAQFISEERGDSITSAQVKNNEARWGLKKARGVDINRRVLRYDRDMAVKALKAAGVI